MNQYSMTRWWLIAAVTIITCAPGCHRSYYRRQADIEAQRLVIEKTNDPRWNSSDGSIEVDPMSRMFDPFSKDHPPIPPDDPTSSRLMRCVNGKEGYPHWHANGDTSYVESPEWRSYLPMNEEGEIVIDLNGAYRLALLHSPELQEQRETLYLSALDVSLDRFGFDSQLFTGFNSFLTTQGRLRTGGSQTTVSNSIGANGEGLRLQKLGITGANFAVGLANSILWNFAGPNTQTASSLIDFSLVQPLLRGAGRDRILESLTQAERTLLANVRQMDRFRRGFYLQTITGRDAGAGPNRAGSFLGLPGSAGTGVDGYFGLLLQQQQIRIQEFNVRQLENVLEQFREFYLRERVDSLQVRQFENSLYDAQRRLLQAKTNYENSLDRFKRNLGLPPDLEVVISDPSLDQFELISNEITEHQNDLNVLKNETGEALIALGELIPEIPDQTDEANEDESIVEAQVEWPSDLNEKVKSLDTYVEKALQLLQVVKRRDRVELERDFQRLDRVRPNRVQYLEKLRDAIESGEMLSDIEPAILKADSIREGDDLRSLLGGLVKRLDTYETNLKNIRDTIAGFEEKREEFADDAKLSEYIRTQLLETVPEQLTDFSNTLLEMSLLQAQSRANSVELPEVQLDSESAFRIAKCFRRDLMNARAGLVDQWRQIEFVADQLEAQVDLVFEGEVGNFGDNPFKLRYETGQLRAGFRFDAPIVRLAERNEYRETLIEYQQARRDYYQFEDELNRNLRQTLRTLDLNKILYEVNRKSIQIRIEEVELARFRLEEPARAGSTRSSLGATTANDLTRALNGLQNAQNDFLDVWVRYEVLRRGLDFDLGTMQVDPLGEWIDPGKIDFSIAQRAASMLGLTFEQMCCDLSELGMPGNVSAVEASANQPQGLGFEQDPNQTPDIPPQNDYEYQLQEPLPYDTPQDDGPSAPPSPEPNFNEVIDESVLDSQSSSRPRTYR